MNLLKILVLSLLIPALFFPESSGATEVVVYAYDSLVGKGTLGEVLAREFKKKHGATVRFVTFGSSGEALNQISIEGKNTRADVLLGIDNSLLDRALDSGHFRETTRHQKWVPFDFGFPTLVYDSSRFTPPSKLSLESVVSDPSTKKSIALIDPRTSSLGRIFLAWTEYLFPNSRFEGFWTSLMKSSLTIAPGWSGAYGLFLKNEAKLVLSYTTSPAYHMHHEKTERIRALLFPEGHPRQTEGALVVRYSKQLPRVANLLQTLLSREVQAAIPLTQFMYPINEATPLPGVFGRLEKPKKTVEISLPADMGPVLRRWSKVTTQ